MRSKWINRVLSVALLFTTLTTSVSYTFTTAYAEEAGASTQQSAQSGVSWPEAPEISAGNGILIDADTGAILYEKNAYTKCYPASTTKILTGLFNRGKLQYGRNCYFFTCRSQFGYMGRF